LFKENLSSNLKIQTKQIRTKLLWLKREEEGTIPLGHEMSY
jgi:hypothetical protein